MTTAQIGQAAEPSPFAALREVALLPSDDDVKRDLEVTCLTCGAHLCDAEPYDILEILALSAAGHQHIFRPLVFFGRPLHHLAPIEIGAWDPANGTVTDPGGVVIGNTDSADGARVIIRDSRPSLKADGGDIYWQPDKTVPDW